MKQLRYNGSKIINYLLYKNFNKQEKYHPQSWAVLDTSFPAHINQTGFLPTGNTQTIIQDDPIPDFDTLGSIYESKCKYFFG